MKLSEILSIVGLAPKDLEQARSTIEPAKAALEQVNTLFANAGLNLEAMLEAGPDSLKAHIDSIGQSNEELAAALLEIERVRGEADIAEAALAKLQEAVAATGWCCDGVDDVKTAFADHVKKAAAIELAKVGHPPVAVIPTGAAAATDSEIFAQYKAMQTGEERLAFYAKHEAAIRRAAGFKD